jgi:hypothetical protein
MMIKSTLVVATLATLLAGSALADDKSKHGDHDRFRGEAQTYRQDDQRHDGRHYDDRRHDYWRSDRHWRHVPPSYYRGNKGYRAGYESGWHDGSRNCRFDYRPGRWYRNPRDDYWYFGFEING